MNKDESYVRGRSDLIAKVLGLQNADNIHADKRRQAKQLVYRKLHKDNINEVAAPAAMMSVAEPEPEVEPDMPPQEEKLAPPQEPEEFKYEPEPEPERAETPVVEERTHSRPPPLQIPLSARVSSFHRGYNRPKHSQPPAPEDDNEDGELSFAARRMRGGSGTSARSVPPSPAYSAPPTPQMRSQSRASYTSTSNEEKSRSNLRHRMQIDQLREKCEALCLKFKKNLKDLITEDAPREEWINLHKNLLQAKKKTATIGIYRDVLDWSALFVQRIANAFKPAGFTGGNFARTTRECKEFDEQLEDLYEDQDAPLFRNIPPTAMIANLYVKNFAGEQTETIKEALNQQEEKAPAAAPPVAPKKKLKKKHSQQPLSAAQLQQMHAWFMQQQQNQTLYAQFLQQQPQPPAPSQAAEPIATTAASTNTSAVAPTRNRQSYFDSV